MKIKTAVIGLGRIAWDFHLPELARHPAFSLEAVSDPLPERVVDTCERFHVPRGYRSGSELLAAEHPDLTVIASPTCCHKVQILEAFQAGSDVFCDKPLALSLAEAREIAAAARMLNRKLMVYQPHRVTPEATALRGILEEGALGRIFMVRRVWARFQRRNDWQAYRASGGGMLNNYGSHFLDQFIGLFGAGFQSSTFQTRRILSGGDAEDIVKATLVKPDGLLFDLEINMASAFDSSAWEVYGDRGSARLLPEQQAWELRCLLRLPPLEARHALAAAGRLYPSEELNWRARTVGFSGRPIENFYERVTGYLAGTEAPLVPLAETLAVMELLESARTACNHPRETNPHLEFTASR